MHRAQDKRSRWVLATLYTLAILAALGVLWFVFTHMAEDRIQASKLEDPQQFHVTMPAVSP